MLNLYNSWLNSAGVRRGVDFNNLISDGYFCPEERQPLLNYAKQLLVGHPEQEIILKNAEWILLQSFYYYLLDVASLETAFICKVNSGIINDDFSVKFDQETKIVASTIIIDEGFHTNLALLAIEKIKELTNIQPLKTIHDANIYQILQCCYQQLNPELHDNFNLLVNCILENTLTKDLDLVLTKKDISQLNSFTLDVLEKHFRDEARHSVYAFKVAEQFWQKLEPTDRVQLIPALKYFVNEYLEHDILQDINFNRIILASLNISYATASAAMEYCQHFNHSHKETLKQSLTIFLQKVGIDLL